MRTSKLMMTLCLMVLSASKVYAEAGPDNNGTGPERILSCATEGLPYLEKILYKRGYKLEFKKSSLDKHLAAELPNGRPVIQPLEFYYVSNDGKLICDNGKVKHPFRLVGEYSSVQDYGRCGNSKETKKACCEFLAKYHYYNDPKNDLGIELPINCGVPF